MDNIIFDSESNYMKRSKFCDSAILTLGGAGTTVSQTVVHNLGYIPFFDVFVDQTGDDTIWSPQKINLYTETSLSGVSLVDPTVRYWSTKNTLTIQLINNTTPTATGTRVVYWLIYLDYGNVS